MMHETSPASERWRRIKDLFQAAVELDPGRREAFLDEQAAGDTSLRCEVVSLLAAEDDPMSLFDDSAFEIVEDGAVAAVAGRRIGPYRLLRPIATGGMSTVFLARRDDGQYRQQVALKLVRHGWLTGHLVERFFQERQILAGLDHPNIARLLDGGVTGEALPYLVLEHIDGEPIDRYCERRELPLDERLHLFRTVCAAVGHAHRSLVIHRDLKPGNILVTAEGVPKLLDFGIAKLLDPVSGSAATVTGWHPMTPEYASPEQALGERVTTASDVYSLGVVLYKLLCGQAPYRLAGCSHPEMERVICRQEPADVSSTAARSGGDRLRRRLQGDLDNIVRKALCKEPERRYGTVEQLSEDLRRHLEGLPVIARRATWSYRCGKFIRRHRLGMTAAALVVAALVAGIVATTWQARKAKAQQAKAETEWRRAETEWRRAETERATAERVTRFLVDLFHTSDPGETLVEEVKARHLLDRGAERLGRELADSPQVRATLMHTVGEVYANLSLYDEALPLLEEALRLRTRLLGDADPETLETRILLAVVTWKRGRFDRAETLLEETVKTARVELGRDHPVRLSALHELAVVWSRRDRHAEAEPLLREARDISRRVLGEEHDETRWATLHLAQIVAFQGRYEEAEEELSEVLVVDVRKRGEGHPDTLFTHDNLGALYTEMGRYEEAEALLVPALRLRRQLLGHDHRSTLSTLYNLAVVFQQQGRRDAAEELYLEGLESASRTLGPRHRLTLLIESRLGLLELELDRIEDASRRLTRALELLRAVDGETHRRSLDTCRHLALVRLAEGRPAEASALLAAAVTTAKERSNLPARHQQIGWLLAAYGRTLTVLGQSAEARRVLREARDILRRALGPDHDRTREATRWLRETEARGYLRAVAADASEEIRASFRDKHPTWRAR